MGKAKSPAMRRDGLMNLLTGQGDFMRDKRKRARWVLESVSYDELDAQYRTSDVSATVIEAPTDEMFRRGFDIAVGEKEDDEPDQEDGSGDEGALKADDDSADGGRELADNVVDALDETDHIERIKEGINWGRLFGGAGVLLGADDGQEASEPLDEENIETFDSLTTLSPRELRPVSWEDDIESPRFGQPVLYEIQVDPLPSYSGTTVRTTNGARKVRASPAAPSTILVHHTRILRFDGVRTTRRSAFAQSDLGYGWGDSILLRCRDVIRDYETAWASAALILQSFARTVVKSPIMGDAQEGEASYKAFLQRMGLAQATLQTMGLLILDTAEEFESQSVGVAGLADLLQQKAVRVAAAARMPVTVLMGQSPAGMNATGESDMRLWYAKVAAEQNKVLRPALERVLRLMFRSKTGPTQGKEPKSWRIKFRPLWAPTDLETAQLRKAVADTDKIYLDAGVLHAEEVAISRFGGAEYSMETTIDPETRKTLADGPRAPIDEENAQAEREANGLLQVPPSSKGLAPGIAPPKQLPAGPPQKKADSKKKRRKK